MDDAEIEDSLREYLEWADEVDLCAEMYGSPSLFEFNGSICNIFLEGGGWTFLP